MTLAAVKGLYDRVKTDEAEIAWLNRQLPEQKQALAHVVLDQSDPAAKPEAAVAHLTRTPVAPERPAIRRCPSVFRRPPKPLVASTCTPVERDTQSLQPFSIYAPEAVLEPPRHGRGRLRLFRETWIMVKLPRLTFLLTALCMGVPFAAPAFAQTADSVPRITVNYGDLDLTSPAGVATFDRRLRDAVKMLYPEDREGMMIDSAVAQARREALDRVQPQRAAAIAAATNRVVHGQTDATASAAAPAAPGGANAG